MRSIRSILTLCGLLCALGACSKTDDEPPTAPAAEAPAPPAGEAKAEAEAEAPAEPAAEPTPTSTPTLLGALSAEHTVAAAGAEGLDAFATQLATVVDALPASVKAELPGGFDAITAKLGFDPRTAEGWATVGLDPAAGVALVVDSRLRPADGAPWPVLLAKVTDRGKLVAALAKIDPKFELALPETDGVARLGTPEGPALLGERGGFTAVLAVPDPAQLDAARAAFAGWLKAQDAPLAEAEALAPAMAMPGAPAAGRAWAAAVTGPLLAMAPQALAPVFAEFYAARFPAVSLAFGADLQTGRLRVQGDAAAVSALRQVLIPPKPAPALDRFAPPDGIAIGVSIDPVELFDGVVALIPPARGDLQGQVLIGKNAIPVALGVSLDDLAKGFTGHGAVLLTREAITTPGAEPPMVIALGVADAEVADRALTAALDQLAKQSGGAREPTKFGALEGHVLRQDPAPTFLVRAGDALLLGPSRARIEEALARGEGQRPADAPAVDFADGAFYSAAVSMKLLDEAKATLPPDAVEVFEAGRAFWQKRLGPTFAMALRVDDAGLVADGPAAAAVIGAMAAVAVPAFVQYVNRSKSAQARVNVTTLFTAAMLARLEEKPLSAAPLTPPADPCADGGGSYTATAATWSHPTWKTLGFAPIGEQYYRYAFEPGEGQAFVVRAVGDLDCDGVQSTYERAADAEGQALPEREVAPLE